MNKELRILTIKIRIAELESRGDNAPIVNKLKRELRRLGEQ